MGRKVSDEFTVPLCRTHHREAHRCRDERAWWRRLGLDVLEIAGQLWKETRLSQPEKPKRLTVAVPNANIEQKGISHLRHELKSRRTSQ
jgi:hypothetical protein